MNETSLLNNIFKLRAKKIDKYATEAEAIQMRVLTELVQKAAGTEWGKEHNYSTIRSYEDFARNVSVQDYESLKGYIDRMRHGESDVLWRGECRWFAKSSGTTNDKSKFIPVTADGLKTLHYTGGRYQYGPCAHLPCLWINYRLRWRNVKLNLVQKILRHTHHKTGVPIS